MAKVLVVDDAKIMRRNLTKYLTEMGHQVIGEAVDGIDAVDKFKSLDPELVTMDITMPNMDGIEAVKQIIALKKDAKIIMVSSHGQKDMVIQAITNGASHYILKPINIDALKDSIKKVLG
jgi:two-component system chemotaxis response regulator CheY